MQCAAGRRRVGAHQAAGAQQDTAEIPRDDYNHVRHARVADGLQHRGAGRLGGFAVVGVAGAAVLQHVGVDVMPRGAVGGAHGVQHSQSLFLGIGKGGGGDKAAALFLVRKGRGPPQGLVVRHGGTPWNYTKTSASADMRRRCGYF